MNHWIHGAALAVLVTAISACGPSPQDIADLKESQEKILAKLGQLEEQVKARPAAPAGRRQPPSEDYSKVYKINYDNALVKGNASAPVTLVEYSDFECPYCAKVREPIEALLKKYPEKLRVVYKHFPLAFHKSARPLAVASLAAGEQDCFWQFHDVAFEATEKRALSADNAEAYAKEAGCNVDRFKADLAANREKYEKQVDADYREGGTVDVRGTPALYINGRKVQNRSVDGMSAMVEEAAKGG